MTSFDRVSGTSKSLRNSNIRNQQEYLPVVFILLVTVCLAVRLLRLTSHYAVNIFFLDQWDFNSVTLFEKHSLWEIFNLEFGPHRLGMGGLLSKWIEPLFGWNSRTESFVACGIVVCSVFCALLLKRRLSGSFSFWDAVIPAILLTPAQFEVIFGAVDFAYGLISILLLLCYCLAWTCETRKLRYPLVLILNFLTIFTGFGVFLGFITPILLVLDYYAHLKNTSNGKAWLIGSLAFSLASLARFFMGYIFQTATDCFTVRWTSPQDYARFMYLMFAHLFGMQDTGRASRWVGMAIMAWLGYSLFASVKWMFTRPEGYKRNVVATALLAFVFLYGFNTAIGRMCLGIQQTMTSRYISYLVMGALGLYLHIIGIRGNIVRNTALGLLALLLLRTVPIQREDRRVMEWFRSTKYDWKSCYLAGGTIEECDERVPPGVYPWPQANNLQGKLNFLRSTRQNLFIGLK